MTQHNKESNHEITTKLTPPLEACATGHHRRALSLGQNAAWATWLDGTTFPAGGY
jgi:hypothetical protein